MCNGVKESGFGTNEYYEKMEKILDEELKKNDNTYGDEFIKSIENKSIDEIINKIKINFDPLANDKKECK